MKHFQITWIYMSLHFPKQISIDFVCYCAPSKICSVGHILIFKLTYFTYPTNYYKDAMQGLMCNHVYLEVWAKHTPALSCRQEAVKWLWSMLCCHTASWYWTSGSWERTWLAHSHKYMLIQTINTQHRKPLTEPEEATHHDKLHMLTHAHYRHSFCTKTSSSLQYLLKGRMWIRR